MKLVDAPNIRHADLLAELEAHRGASGFVLEPGRDFLAKRKPRARHIVTNPPYGRGLAEAFVKHALELTAETGGGVAMLVNLLSLCHPLRHDFYLAHPPAVIYALDECICWPYGDPSQATTTIAKQRYCWLVWKNGHKGPTEFQWLSTKATVTRVT